MVVAQLRLQMMLACGGGGLVGLRALPRDLAGHGACVAGGLLKLCLQVRGRMEVATAFPRAPAFHEVHADSDQTVARVGLHVKRRMRETALALGSFASASLVLSAHLRSGSNDKQTGVTVRERELGAGVACWTRPLSALTKRSSKSVQRVTCRGVLKGNARTECAGKNVGHLRGMATQGVMCEARRKDTNLESVGARQALLGRHHLGRLHHAVV